MKKDFVEDLMAAVGARNILSDPASLLLYSYDAALDKALPGIVVLPNNAEEAAAAVRLAWRHKIPFVARGAGTNLCGGSVPAEEGLVIHLARMNRILDLDAGRRRAVVEPGVVNLHLQKAAAVHGLFYAPDPASQKACTLGGNVGTNAGGPHCLKYGVTTHHVKALEMVLPDGEIVHTSIEDPGYDLTGLFVGSEGTLGVATRIEVDLLPLPESLETLLAAFPSMESAAQTVTDIVCAGILPTTLEIMDRLTVEAVEAFVHAGYPKEAEAVLLIEVDGPRDRVKRDVDKIQELCHRNGCGDLRQARNEEQRQKLWEGRRGSYPAMARLAPNVLVEDGVVPRTRLPEAVRRIRAIAARENLRMGLIAHAGDGNLHPNMIFDERDAEETRRVKSAGYEMLKVCVDLGGSISGEHGIGTDKREAMRWLFTPSTLRLFRRLKNAFDPENLCNPDKLIPVVEDPGQEPAPAPALALPGSGALRIETVDQLQEALKAARRNKKGVFLRGQGTKGFPVPSEALALELRPLSRVLDWDKENFTLTVQAGAALDELRSLTAEAGQYLHIAGQGTLGGVLSARSSRAPRLRDQVIGLKAVLAGGERVEFGAKVMKNVAGYDAAKLFLGAWGTLGAIYEVTLRLFPFPAEKEEESLSQDFSWVRSPLFQKIKKTFDPDHILNPSVFYESFKA